MIVGVRGLSDPRLDDYRNVPDPDLLRARGIFIAEGRLVVRRLLEEPRFRTRSVLLTQAAYAALADIVASRPDLLVYIVTQEAMNEVTGFNIHRGCLAIGERPPALQWTDVVQDASVVVVLERVSNADNVGGIFRSAAAFGANAVLLGPGCADPLYRKAIRTSMGAALHVPFAGMPDWPEDLARLQNAGFRLLALTPNSEAPPLERIGDVRQHPSRRKVALMIGHEGEGLSAEAIAAADVCVRIPMAASVDSLNAATAAAIGLYELTRR